MGKKLNEEVFENSDKKRRRIKELCQLKTSRRHTHDTFKKFYAPARSSQACVKSAHPR